MSGFEDWRKSIADAGKISLDPIDDQPTQPSTDWRESIRLVGEEQAAIRDSQLRQSIAVAIESNPEFVAEAQRIGLELDADPRAIERDLDGYRKVMRKVQLDRWVASMSSPILRRQMSDPAFARLAYDDSDNLSALERAAKAYRIGALTDEYNSLRARERDAGLSDAEAARRDEIGTYLSKTVAPGGFIGSTAEILGQLSQSIPKSLESGLALGIGFGTTALVAGNLGPQAAAPEEILTVPASAIGGFIVGSAGEFFKHSYEVEGGGLYASMIDEGIDPSTAAWVSRFGGAAVASVDLVGGGLVAKGAGLVAQPVRRLFSNQVSRATAEALAKPGMRDAAARFARGYITGYAGEVSTEAVQEVVGIASEELARAIDGKKLKLTTAEGRAEAAAQVGEVIAKTAMGMALLSLPGPSVRFLSDRHRVKRTRENEALFERWATLATDSKVRQRNPEAMQKFADAVLEEDADVYVSADALNSALQQTQMTREQLARDLPGVEEQIDAALTTGGDVVIPVGQYSARVVGTKLDAALRQHVRRDPDGYSPAEADEIEAVIEQLAPDVAETVEKTATFAEEARAAEESVRQQIAATGRVGPAESRDSAAVFRAFLETQSERLNVSPAELAETLGFRVQRGETPTSESVASEAPESPATGPAPEASQDAPSGGIVDDAPPQAAEGTEEGPLTQPDGEDGQVAGEFNPETGTVTLFEGADVTTVLHEMAHGFLHWYGQMAAAPNAPTQIVDDFNTFLAWREIEGGVEEWNGMTLDEQRPHHEAFAEAFEDYAFGGQAPSLPLQSVFSRFRRWISKLWRNLRTTVEVPAEVRGVFDRMLASDDAIAHAEAARGLAPLFETKPEGMSDAAWASYQNGLDEAVEAAVAQVAKRSLRDIQWLRNATTKKLRELQKQHDAERAKLEEQVREEVENEPVYRAFEFLRNGRLLDNQSREVEFDGQHKLDTESVRNILNPKPKKPTNIGDMELLDAIASLGGINREQARKHGIDPAELNERRNIGGRIRYVFPKKGRTVDDVSVALREAGFKDFVDEGQLMGGVSESLLGSEVFSSQKQIELSELNELAPDDPTVVADTRTTLRDLRITKRGGLEPDLVAPTFGFKNGTEFVKALVEAPPLDEVVQRQTDALMIELHGDLVDPGAVKKAVDEALHNTARAKFVATELKALSGATQPTRLMVAAARQVAQDTLAKMTVREIKAWRFQAGEARANRAALRAASKGETDVAVRAKRAELLQHEMAREAAKIEKEVADAESRFKKFYQADKKLARYRNVDIVAIGRAVLASYGLGKRDRPVAQYVQDVAKYNPELFEELSDLTSQISDGQTPYRLLTLDAFRTLVDAVDALWHRSRRENQILVDGERVEKQTIVDKLLAIFDPPDRDRPTRSLTSKERRGKRFHNVLAGIRHVESWALQYDGGSIGDVHRYLFSLLREPFDAYQLERSKILGDLSTSLKKLDLSARDIEAHEIEFTFNDKNELLGALLHSGNESNLRKLLLGRKWVEAPETKGAPIDTRAWWNFVARMIDDGVLTQQDFEFVQSVWDAFEELFPRSQKEHFDLYGYRAEALETQTIATPWGEFRGGYYPAQVDHIEIDNNDLEPLTPHGDSIVDSSREFRSAMPSTGRGHMMERVEINYPLVMDVRMVSASIDDHLRFVHLQRPGRDVLRLLRDPKLAKAISRVDPGAIDRMFLPWLQATLQNQVMKRTSFPEVDKVLTMLRRNTGLAIMFGNTSVALQQLTGFGTSLSFVPLGYMRSSLATYLRNPKQTFNEVVEASDFMKTRLLDAAGQITDDARLFAGPEWQAQLREWTQRHGYFLQRWFQIPVDVVTWSGAYDAEIAKGVDHDVAVRAADTAVRRSQASGLAPDISTLERGNAVVRLFTQFTSFWMATTNSLIQEPSLKRASLIVAFAGLSAATLTKALEGGWEDDDQDGEIWDDVGHWMFRETANTGASVLLPGPLQWFARPITGEFGGRISGPAAFGSAERSARALAVPLELMFEEGRELSGRDVKDVATLFTMLLGIPFTAPAKPIAYEVDVQRGKKKPTSGGDHVRGLIVGR